MAWSRSEPVATDSLATSQSKLSANFSYIEAVLGSSTLTNGIVKVQGDILYASTAETIAKLAKASGKNYYLTNGGTNNNPSWGSVNASDGITGVLPVANGGTGVAVSNVASGVVILDASGYVPDSSVDTGALKTTTGEVTYSTQDTIGHQTLPGGTYGFYPQVKMGSTDSRDVTVTLAGRAGAAYTNWTTYTTTVGLFISAAAQTVYVQQRYVTSSGVDYWVFLLIDKKTGDILQGYSAPDHPCYGNGGDFEKLPHPFSPDILSSQEVVLVDNKTVTDLKFESMKAGKSLLMLINEFYKVDLTEEERYIPLHSGRFLDMRPVLVNTIPDFIKIRKLALMTEEERKEKKERQDNLVEIYNKVQKAKEERLTQKLGISTEELKELKELIG